MGCGIGLNRELRSSLWRHYAVSDLQDQLVHLELHWNWIFASEAAHADVVLGHNAAKTVGSVNARKKFA